MKITPLTCKIEIFSAINPSEDADKIEFAVENVLPNCKIITEKFSIRATSNDIHSLEKIRENIDSTNSSRIYLRTLEKNSNQNSTWFYLNKQAAFADKIAICEEADESPLGPLKIILTSTDINRTIDWLTHREE